MEMETHQSESSVVTNELSPDISFKVVGPNVGIVKEIRAELGGDSFKKDKACSTYDRVEHMEYLYVRVVKARGMALFGRVNLFGEVNVGNHKGITLTTSPSNPKWDQVFAFSNDCIQSSTVEIFVKENYKIDYVGRVWFGLSEVPCRVPPDSQLKPKWYGMEDKKGDKAKTGELKLSVWFGTQADEAFSKAWLSNAAAVHSCFLSQVYLSPKLWCLRVLIIEAQNIMPGHRGSDIVRFPQFSANVQLGDQCRRTVSAAPSATRSFSNPYWNEELLFVVAEPFKNDLLVTVEDQVEPGRDIVVARVLLPLATVEKRADEKPVNSKWFDVDSHFGDTDDKNKLITKIVSQVHMRVLLDEGYNLVDEDTIDDNDVGPNDKRLWKPKIGVLEMGILGATGLIPMKTNHSTDAPDAYCVAKYGGKWVRTRTVVSSLSPMWNEQFMWEVYDPCTVVTIGVFSNCKICEKPTTNDATCDYQYGKVRIRLSTLETNRVYTHLSYPLLILRQTGLWKMGDLQLAMRFSCTNMANMLYKYTIPVLPKMHSLNALNVDQLNMLRYKAVDVVASRLSRVEPPLGREVVRYMLYHDRSPSWSMRRSKVVFNRIMSSISSLFAKVEWIQAICNWQKPMHSVLFLIIFLTLLMLDFIIPAIFFYFPFVGLWNYRYRPQNPPCLDIILSCAKSVHPDELDEEFDTYPTTNPTDIVRMRYDRLRSISGRFQTIVGDIASMIERFEALLSWRDPRASSLFVIFCLVAAVGFYVVPIRIVVALLGLYLLSPPWLRSRLPSPAINFFKRLPTRVDSLIYSFEGDTQEIEDFWVDNMLENFQQCIKLFM